MKFLRDIPELSGKKVLLRADFNVPIEKGVVMDDFRITKTIPTIEYLRKAGAKTIIVAHLENEENDSLLPVFENLKKHFPVTFVENFQSDEGKKILEGMSGGDVVLLQNIRHFEGEKKNDPVFSKILASLADVYVNDAFSVSHRPHASVVGVPKYIPGFVGPLFETEIENLSKAFHPMHPFVFILAGAKFDTKLPLVQKFLELADTVFIGGALANDLFKAKGMEVGDSYVSEVSVDLSLIAKNPKLLLPLDVVLKDKTVVSADAVKKGDQILDAGPKTIEKIKQLLSGAKFVLWNGTLGVCEDGYTEGTYALAEAVVGSGASSMVGGGDTLAAIAPLHIFSRFSFVSTGGGAMLDFLANETLPGIEALK